MKLTIYSKFLNIHQVAVADELYSLLGEDFHFVATMSPRIEELKGASDCSSRCYCVRSYESESEYEHSMQLATDSDVCVFGGFSMEYAVRRAKMNPHGLSFEMSERWLKQGWKNMLSPNFCKWWLNYIRFFRKANFYKLCASAFTSKDDDVLCIYKQCHFKWGYFVPSPLKDKTRSTQPSQYKIMWCARFIDWKHPEMAVSLSKRLKASGYDYSLDMFGDGPLRLKMEDQVEKQNLKDNIHFHGNVPNEQIHAAMKECDIFLFTSDRQEGWGVVVNEAMSNGAVVVASDEIGSVPFLIKDNVTGMIFKTCNLDSLYEKVSYLMEHPDKLSSISEAAMKQMQDVWSPKQAAINLLLLIDDIQSGRESSLQEGPCSVC